MSKAPLAFVMIAAAIVMVGLVALAHSGLLGKAETTTDLYSGGPAHTVTLDDGSEVSVEPLEVVESAGYMSYDNEEFCYAAIIDNPNAYSARMAQVCIVGEDANGKKVVDASSYVVCPAGKQTPVANYVSALNTVESFEIKVLVDDKVWTADAIEGQADITNISADIDADLSWADFTFDLTSSYSEKVTELYTLVFFYDEQGRLLGGDNSYASNKPGQSIQRHISAYACEHASYKLFAVPSEYEASE